MRAVPARHGCETSRAVIPEHRTQLYHTPPIPLAAFEHRLRYNQLFGLRINEYVMMLEEELTDRLLLPLCAARGRAPMRNWRGR